jgi:hypothetical protein
MGTIHSCYLSCKEAQQISEDDYERLDQLHYKVENAYGHTDCDPYVFRKRDCKYDFHK